MRTRAHIFIVMHVYLMPKSISGGIEVTCGGDDVDEMLDVTRKLLGLQVSLVKEREG